MSSPLGADRLAAKAVDVPVRRVADMNNADLRLRGQTAVAGTLEDVADERRQFVGDDKLAAPGTGLIVPMQTEGGRRWLLQQRLQCFLQGKCMG